MSKKRRKPEKQYKMWYVSERKKNRLRYFDIEALFALDLLSPRVSFRSLRDWIG